ncbi:Polygalacturonase-like [Orobanche minor]
MGKIAGNMVASDNFSNYSKDERHWITFDSVKNILIDGGGASNGKEKAWWDNS